MYGDGRGDRVEIHTCSRYLDETLSVGGDQALCKVRGCLGFGAAGERDELWDGFVPALSARSWATNLKIEDEDAQRSRAQPSIQNLNSLSARLCPFAKMESAKLGCGD